MQDKRDLGQRILMKHRSCSHNTSAEHWARSATIQSSLGWWSLLLLCCLCTAPPAWAAKCLFISSYHQGYDWSDGIERGVRAVLQGHCELQQFDMDAKRHKEPEEIAQKALEAQALIEAWRPDVVLTADDDAAQYLIMPFYKDHTLPFVFCGINWTVKEYGFPYRNVTGMIEVAPIEPLFDQAKTLLPAHSRAFYLGANTSTERKNLERFQAVATRRGIQLDSSLVDTTEAWLAAFHRAQQYDFIVLGSNAGINDWHDTTALASLGKNGQRLTLTNHEWMMPFTMVGLTKVPEEQGEWAAKTALQILHGVAPASIPIVPNRKWDIWINPLLVETAGIALPKPLLQKAKKVN
jgi:ABC-type uncharacterized transport system substrate-binding protein